MSNLRNTTRLPPARSSTTNRWKSHTLTNDLSERKTRTLEGNSNKSKLTMQRDKAKTTMEIYRRSKPIPQLPIRRQPAKCGQCETEEAKLKCLECVEVYCASCYSQFHLRGALQRHHNISLPMFGKKTTTGNSEINPPMANVVYPPVEQTANGDHENDNLHSFQQRFLQWREDNLNKSQRTQQKRGLTSPTFPRTDAFQKLPSIDSNSPKTSSDESLLPSRYRSNNSMNQEFMQQPLTKANLARKNQPKVNVTVRVHHTLSDPTNSLNLEPAGDIVSMTQTEENLDAPSPEETSKHYDILVVNDEQERPISRASLRSLSRSISPSMKRDPIALSEQPLRSTLATKSTDELEVIVTSQINFSRPSSSHSEKPTKPSHDAPVVQNDLPPIAQSNPVEQNSSNTNQTQFSLPINPLKDQPMINSSTTTPRRHSPFSFSNSLYKNSRMNSASSIEAGDDGFFTDLVPRKSIPTPLPPPPPILECSTSNEWKHGLENHLTQSNHIVLPKLSIPNLSRPLPKQAIPPQTEIVHRPTSPIDNDSRPGSSLSSGSIPLSITSSKSDFNPSRSDSSTTPPGKSSTSTAKNSSSSTTTTTTTTTKASASSATKKSSSPTTTSKTSTEPTTTSKTSTEPTSTSKDTSSVSTTTITTTTTETSTEKEPTIIKDENVVPSRTEPDQLREESNHSLKERSLSTTQVSEKTPEPVKSVPSEHLTREKVITEKQPPIEKKSHQRVRRHPQTSDEPSQRRKLEFSVGDGLKWQEASLESMSPMNTTVSKQSPINPRPQSLSSSNTNNTKIAEQFHRYDNDDGRSSRAHQNLNDEQCFNQLCNEFCSELNMQSSDEDALLNEQLLKILQNNRNPFNENELPLLESKLREKELITHD